MAAFSTRDYCTRNALGDESQRWKQVTLKIANGEEEIVVPMMQASTGMDLKTMLSDSLGLDFSQIEILSKNGPTMKKVKNSDEVPTKIFVKGIKSFARSTQEYPHPYGIIGGGYMGLSMALHCERKNKPYELFERKFRIGGNRWTVVANQRSKLQAEGPQYQLNWSATDGGAGALAPFEKYSFWPTRDEVLVNLHDVVTQYNMWPRLNLGCSVTEMKIHKAPGQAENLKHYEIAYEDLERTAEMAAEKDDDEDDEEEELKKKPTKATRAAMMEEDDKVEKEAFNCCCLSIFPGASAAPHRKAFAGEDEFGAMVGYGFGDEYDYTKVANKAGLLVGMGAMAVENVRILMEHRASLIYIIARHHNLVMPRMVSWFINQARIPPQASMVLRGMEPMYKLHGKDPWQFFSVESTIERQTANIKQYARWGISDLYFLCIYYGKVETIEGQVKRLKPRSAVITSGRVIDDLDHCIKVLGFDTDFSIDLLMKMTAAIGFWPDGDYRRWICSEVSSVDGNRMTSFNSSPYAAQATCWPMHFFEYPEDAKKLLFTGIFPENHARPDEGAAAYHYDPRTAATVISAYSGAVPALAKWTTEVNDPFKKESMWSCAPPEKFLNECEKDWDRYSKALGGSQEPPPYPYKLDQIYDLLLEEQKDIYSTNLVSSGQMRPAQLEEVMGQWKVWAQGCVAKGTQKLKDFEMQTQSAPTFSRDGRLAKSAPRKRQSALTEQNILSQRIDEEYELRARSSTTVALQSASQDAKGNPAMAAARHVFEQRASLSDGRLASVQKEQWLQEAAVVATSTMAAATRAMPKGKAKSKPGY